MPKKVMNKTYHSIGPFACHHTLIDQIVHLKLEKSDALCVSNFTVYLLDKESLHSTPQIVHTSLASGSILDLVEGGHWEGVLVEQSQTSSELMRWGNPIQCDVCTHPSSSSGQCGNGIVQLLLYVDVPHRASKPLQDGEVFACELVYESWVFALNFYLLGTSPPQKCCCSA